MEAGNKPYDPLFTRHRFIPWLEPFDSKKRFVAFIGINQFCRAGLRCFTNLKTTQRNWFIPMEATKRSPKDQEAAVVKGINLCFVNQGSQVRLLPSP